MDARCLHGVGAIGELGRCRCCRDGSRRSSGSLPSRFQCWTRAGAVVELTGDDRIHDPETTRVELFLRTEHHGVSDAQTASSDRPASRRRGERGSGEECNDGGADQRLGEGIRKGYGTTRLGGTA